MKKLVARGALALSLALSFALAGSPAQAKTLPAPFAPANIYFGMKSAKLSIQDKAQLDKYTGHLFAHHNVKVIGYVQKGKSNKNNKSLSLARANAVANYLKAHNKYAEIIVEARGLPQKNIHSKKARRVTLEFSSDPVFRVVGKLQVWTYDTGLCSSLTLQEVDLSANQTLGIKVIDKPFRTAGNYCEINYQSEYIYADAWNLIFLIKCADMASCNSVALNGVDTTGEVYVKDSIPYLWLKRTSLVDLVDRDLVIDVDGRPMPK